MTITIKELINDLKQYPEDNYIYIEGEIKTPENYKVITTSYSSKDASSNNCVVIYSKDSR